jgi:predicted RNA binding protein with dsRBD fold (UPF0201 family)
MEEMILRIETTVNPTENEEKVKKAIQNLFGTLSFQIKPSHQACILTTETKSQEPLLKFKSVLRNDHIRDAARKALSWGQADKNIRFCLNKQVAFAGHVSFSQEVAESPLGPIIVTIQTENPAQLITWIAPRTIKK